MTSLRDAGVARVPGCEHPGASVKPPGRPVERERLLVGGESVNRDGVTAQHVILEVPLEKLDRPPASSDGAVLAGGLVREVVQREVFDRHSSVSRHGVAPFFARGRGRVALARAARVLVGDLACPPLRPRITA